MAGGPRGWDEIDRWTFKRDTTQQCVGGFGQSDRWQPRERQGYEWPADPSLLGEVLLRGFAEGT